MDPEIAPFLRFLDPEFFLSAAPNPLVGNRRGGTFSRAHLMDPEIVDMVRFLDPETAEILQFLDPEIVKMDKKFWIQKL